MKKLFASLVFLGLSATAFAQAPVTPPAMEAPAADAKHPKDGMHSADSHKEHKHKAKVHKEHSQEHSTAHDKKMTEPAPAQMPAAPMSK